ncbi:hypothetical protein LCGC14_0686850 [marine sediment metagenome]|uniref:Uncharacterized protein n=1 Tax=marine sediment metagenome TaxID=412755 RepID=A0A0F9QLJ8_9ZZZZ
MAKDEDWWKRTGAGAASGAAMGSPGGPLGIGVGALLGGAAGFFGGGGDDEEERLKIISTLNPEQQALMKQYAPWLQGNIGKGLRAWEGPWTAPLGEEEKWGMGKYREAVEGLSPEETRNWYMKYMAPAEERYMKEKILPGIREAGVPGGTLRGTGTEGRVSGAWERFGESQLGRIGGAIQSERAAARGMLPGYMGAASLPRLIEQQDLDKQVAEFIRTTPELSPIMNMIRDILGIQTKAGYFPGQTESPFASILPSLGKLAGGVDWSQFGGTTPTGPTAVTA